jgi:hypothetical protein
MKNMEYAIETPTFSLSWRVFEELVSKIFGEEVDAYWGRYGLVVYRLDGRDDSHLSNREIYEKIAKYFGVKEVTNIFASLGGLDDENENVYPISLFFCYIE